MNFIYIFFHCNFVLECQEHEIFNLRRLIFDTFTKFQQHF